MSLLSNILLILSAINSQLLLINISFIFWHQIYPNAWFTCSNIFDLTQTHEINDVVSLDELKQIKGDTDTEAVPLQLNSLVMTSRHQSYIYNLHNYYYSTSIIILITIQNWCIFAGLEWAPIGLERAFYISSLPADHCRFSLEVQGYSLACSLQPHGH